MNDHDYDNLQFLLTITSSQLEAWHDDLIARGDEDDLAYAMELIQTARNELELRLLEIHDAEAEDEVTQAADYLTRFRLQ